MQRHARGGLFMFKNVFRSLWLGIVLCGVNLENTRQFALAQQDISSGVQVLRSPDPAVRASAAKAFLANWQVSLKDLMEAVNGFDGKQIDTGLSKDDLDFFTRVTDVLRSIVVNYRLSIQKFRELDDQKTSRPLIWAARSSHRELRINATFIMANVADNTNVCIILNHLRQNDISGDGIVNLLQIVGAVASYIYKENFQDAKTTLADLSKNLATRKEDFSRSQALISDVSKRLEMSINKEENLPQAVSFCKSPEAKKL
jgi:hypothetical protein